MNSDLSQNNSKFSVRIVVCDYYLTKPVPGLDVIYSEFRGCDIKQVPVLRVFGPTPEGRKACLHVHGVFPYFYLPCPSSNPEPQFLYQIAASLDKALNIALKQASSVSQHVYKISLVKGLPFYGFHDKEHLFLKVFLYNPGLIRQAVELCSNGAISGQVLQPHESHLNFTLQFFIDFNLFGMSTIDLQSVIFRKDGISQKSDDPLSSLDNLNLKPESVCFYEADCIASHIINRQRIGKGDGIENPGLEEVWNQESERRKQLNVSMASKSLSQGRLKADETESHYKHENIFLMKMSQLIEKPVEIDLNMKKSNETVHYPAEMLDGSQFFNATDVSTHTSEQMLQTSINSTLVERRHSLNLANSNDFETTIVDEDIALNSSFSLQYSQILLDQEDMELVDMLQHMDVKPVEEDSIMGTQVKSESEDELDDAEYSKIFNDDTVLLDPLQNKEESDSAASWDDSFWEGANITQLDGTCDDDHVKKVRKRKMRPFKLGLSRPKSKKKSTTKVNNHNSLSKDNKEINENSDAMHVDNILIDLKNENNTGSQSILKDFDKVALAEDGRNMELDIIYLNNQTSNAVQKQVEPIAGPSHLSDSTGPISSNKNVFNTLESDSSLEEDDIGIKSFYDTSKYFDTTFKCDEIENSDNENDNIHFIKTSKGIHNSEKVSDSNFESNETEKNNNNELSLKQSDTFKIITPKIKPPSKQDIVVSLEKYSIQKVRNPEPCFSNYKDVGDKVEIGQTILKVKSKLARDQKPFEQVLNVTNIEEWRHLLFLQYNDLACETTKMNNLQILLANNRQCILTPVKSAPKHSEVLKWLENKKDSEATQKSTNEKECKIVDEENSSQAIGLNETEIDSSISLEANDKCKNELDNTMQVTMQPDGSFLCFGNSESLNQNSLCTPTLETDFLTIMLLEVHTDVRGDLKPDPALDQIQALFVVVSNDCPLQHRLQRNITEIFVLNSSEQFKVFDRCAAGSKMTYFNNEEELLEKLIMFIKTHDPDIMCGYEIEMNSWGYVLERAQVLGLEIVKEISRITEKNRQRRWRHDDNEMEGRIIGRITFNVWRLFRYELALSSYSFENCVYEVLKERVPTYSPAQLAQWWRHESRIFRWIPLEYYLTRLSGTLRMLEKLDIINRTSELARLFGLQWWEVLSRGSQFRVESLMLRAARPLNLVALSPTVRQRAAMRAPECLPLIFEPESRYYTDPVIVLDFQSLYPSMMIAYNYCFSTCLGRVQNISGDAPYEFGAWKLRIPKAKLQALAKNGLVHWSPVGVGFVKSSVRRGVLPALLRRILAARQAVKKGMKLQTDENVKKAMHSRQLGLKLIANVTYGYTAANFSGRMPCVEVGDSVVAKGRETLERAIRLVASGKWNAKVVYGDTDSMFVRVPGGSRAEAFAIGQEIADAVTADNPSPVALKLEKVYQPCILQTKKRYVGYMYESADQQQPVYEAKGIETVRRDGCPAGVQMLQSALCELFSSGDVSRVKLRVQAALLRLLEGAPPLELMFTREYHGAAGYRPGAAAPPNEIAKRLVSRDRRAEPRVGERVRWSVCAGAPGEPLVRLARTPHDLLRDPALAPHLTYYVARVLLPPLHRCLSLLGLDVFKWWNEIGSIREVPRERAGGGGIARYLQRGRCAVCGARGCRSVCADCGSRTRTTAAALCARQARAQTMLHHCTKICSSCCGHQQYLRCENTECPALWRRAAARHKLEQLHDVIANLPDNYGEEQF